MISSYASVVVICSSRSVSLWWRDFCSFPIAECIDWYLDEPALAFEAVLGRVIANPPSSTAIVVISEHETLGRDSLLVDELRHRGYTVSGVDRAGAALESDKRTAKCRFRARGVRSPAWSDRPADLLNPLFKASCGTRGETVTWSLESEPRGVGYYEEYLSGCEYSAVAVVGRGGMTVLPMVWKGMTEPSLKPPYQRLRLAGPGISGGQHDSDLVGQLCALLPVLPQDCIVEAEFIVSDEGHAYLIEVNPRIAGTTRIAAMSAEYDFIDLAVAGGACDRIEAAQPVRLCAELPVLSGSIAQGSEIQGVYVTSRATISAGSRSELWSKLMALEVRGIVVDVEARRLLKTMVEKAPQSESWELAHGVVEHA